mgnify:CR=1 FL=1
MSERGDKGITSGECSLPVSKDSSFVEAVGSIDEFQARLGHARVLLEDEDNKRFLGIESNLSGVMGVLFQGTVWNNGEKRIKELDSWIEGYTKGENKLKNFLLPGENEIESRLNLCRTGCRTAERRLVTLKTDREENEGLDFDNNILGYFNRLSTYLFWMWQSKKNN